MGCFYIRQIQVSNNEILNIIVLNIIVHSSNLLFLKHFFLFQRVEFSLIIYSTLLCWCWHPSEPDIRTLWKSWCTDWLSPTRPVWTRLARATGDPVVPAGALPPCSTSCSRKCTPSWPDFARGSFRGECGDHICTL